MVMHRFPGVAGLVAGQFPDRDNDGGHRPGVLNDGALARSDDADAGSPTLARGKATQFDPKMSANDTLRLAIELFRASEPSKSAIGIRILSVLDAALAAGKISYGERNESFRSSGKISIEAWHQGDPVNTSIWLVHEAYHLAVKDDGLSYMEEEMTSRVVQCDYAKFLLGGITLGGVTYQLRKKIALLEYFGKDQLVEYVIEHYSSESDFDISAQWITLHYKDYGGLIKRSPDTLKRYAQILVASQPTGRFDPRSVDVTVAVALFEILESNPLTAATIITSVGEREVKVILETLPEKYSDRYKTLKSRVPTLQK